MKETNQLRLRISYQGTEYECSPDMRSLMMIEERVLLHKLASSIIRGVEEIPTTHLIWCIYCLLFCSGARCTADDVRQSVISGDLPQETMYEVARWIISEVYGVSPRDKDEEEADPKT